MWTPEEFEQFMTCPKVGEPVKRAAVLAYYTGARICDLVALPRSARKGGRFELVPQKTRHSTGAKTWIVEHPELTRWLNAAPTSLSTTLLTSETGRPWTTHHLRKVMWKAVKIAGLEGLSFHGLRKALTANLAEHGATDAEIEAVIPHASPSLTRYYRAQADQKKLASAAIAKLSDHQKV